MLPQLRCCVGIFSWGDTWLHLLVHVQDWSLLMFKAGPKMSHGKERGNYKEFL